MHRSTNSPRAWSHWLAVAASQDPERHRLARGRYRSILLLMAMLMGGVLPAADLWVGPGGSDAGSGRGAASAPYATISAAIAAGRTAATAANPAVIRLQPGVYHQSTVTDASNIVILGAGSRASIISGCNELTGLTWVRNTDASFGNGNSIYYADLPASWVDMGDANQFFLSDGADWAMIPEARHPAMAADPAAPGTLNLAMPAKFQAGVNDQVPKPTLADLATGTYKITLNPTLFGSYATNHWVGARVSVDVNGWVQHTFEVIASTRTQLTLKALVPPQSLTKADWDKFGLNTRYATFQANDTQVISGESTPLFTGRFLVDKLPISKNDTFFVYRHKAAIDQPNHWFLGANRRFYLSLAAGATTNGLRLWAKQRALGFDLSGRQVQIRNLGMHGCAVRTSENSQGIVLQDIEARYIAHYTDKAATVTEAKSQFMSSEPWRASNANAKEAGWGWMIGGDGNTMDSCHIGWSAGHGVVLSGNNNTVSRCLIHDIGYTNNDGAGVATMRENIRTPFPSWATSTPGALHYQSALNMRIIGNTIYRGGRALILFRDAAGIDISYNELWHATTQGRDTAAIYTWGGFDDSSNVYLRSDVATAGVSYRHRIHHNYIHDVYPTTRMTSGWMHTDAVYLDGFSLNCDVYRNLVRGIGGVDIRYGMEANDHTSGHRFFNNTILTGTSPASQAFLVNTGSYGISFFNNLHDGSVYFAAPAAGRQSHIYANNGIPTSSLGAIFKKESTKPDTANNILYGSATAFAGQITGTGLLTTATTSRAINSGRDNTGPDGWIDTEKVNAPDIGAYELQATSTYRIGAQALVSEPSVVELAEGGSTQVSLRLAMKPAANVVVAIAKATGGSADLSASLDTLTFTTTNWNTPQIITISAAPDADISNGAARFTCTASGLDVESIQATSTDEDHVALMLSANAVLVPEGGSTGITVRLGHQPTATVAVSLSKSGGDADLMTATGSLTFTSANWNIPQAVSISAAQDIDVLSGTATFTLAAAGLSPEVITATEQEDDVLALVTSALAITAPEGSTGSFNVRLSHQPTAIVNVAVAKVVGGDADLTIPMTSLVFTAATWSTAQTVTVSAAQDVDLANGTASFSCTATGVVPQTVAVTEVDDDHQALVLGSPDLTVIEGSSGTLSLRLSNQPAADVVVTVSKAIGGDPSVTLTPASLSFTAANWSTPQAVRVSAAEDDHVTDGTAAVSFTAAAIASVVATVTVKDNDQMRILASSTTVTVAEGSTGTIAIRLSNQPAANVQVTVAKNAGGDADLTISASTSASIPASILTFTTADWMTPKLVTVTAAQDDDAVAGTAVFTCTSTALTSLQVTVSELDDDTVAPLFSTTSLPVPEGGTAALTVRLAARPATSVTVSLAMIAGGDADLTVTTPTLTFAPDAWNTPMSVTLAAAEDADEANGRATCQASVTGRLSTVVVREIDNDALGPILSLDGPVLVPEGGAVTGTVMLSVAPPGPVSVTVVKVAGGDGDMTSSVASIAFTASDWNTPKVFIIRAAEDGDSVDGAARFTFTLGSKAEVLDVSEADNDVIRPVVTPATTVVVPEGDERNLQVRLSAPPAGQTTVTVTRFAGGDTDLTSATAALVFTASTWSTVQTVALRAAEDVDVVEGSAVFAFAIGTQTVNVTVREQENDVVAPRFAVAGPLRIPENGQMPVAVVLSAQPLATTVVALAMASGGDTDLSVTPSAITFTVDHWNVPQEVIIHAAADDDAADGTAILVATVARESASLSGIETDDDEIVPVLSGIPSGIAEGTTSSILVRLSARPAVNVTVSTSRDAGGDTDLVPSAVPLVFTSANWQVPQVLSITAMADDDAESGSASFTITAEGRTVGCTLTEIDDDQVGPRVSPGATLVVAEGMQSEILVRLSARPTADVVMTAVLSPGGDPDLTLSTDELVFTPADWDQQQVLQVAADMDIDRLDGTSVCTLAVAKISLAVQLQERDADKVAISLVLRDDIVAPGQATAGTISLWSQPAGPVTVTLQVTGGTCSPGSIIFTASDWDQPRSVDVIADHVAEVLTVTATAPGWTSNQATAMVTVSGGDSTGSPDANTKVESSTGGCGAGGGLALLLGLVGCGLCWRRLRA